jgi:antitoxin component of RelBE/YafQ-DinJ toxin-antitoxin module
MKNHRLDIRIDYMDKYKLDYCCDKLGVDQSTLIRSLICIMYHEIDPPFREYSS